MSSFPPKSLSPVKLQMMDVTEVMPEVLMNGFIITTLLTKLVRPIKPTVMTMVLAAPHKLNAEIASHKRDAGLKNELRSTALTNSEMLLVNKT